MKKIIAASLVLLFSVVCLAAESDEINSAISWLKIVDSGSYEKSWHQAAPFFKSQLSSNKWQQALNQVRAPLGKVLSRQVINSTPHSSLPGAPDGEYYVVILATSFEHKESATETITVTKLDNQWRTVGYFIR